MLHLQDRLNIKNEQKSKKNKDHPISRRISPTAGRIFIAHISAAIFSQTKTQNPGNAGKISVSGTKRTKN